MTKEKLNILITEIQNLKVVYKKKYLKYKKIDNTTEATIIFSSSLSSSVLLTSLLSMNPIFLIIGTSLTTISTIGKAIKSVYKLSDKIESLKTTFQQYSDLERDLRTIIYKNHLTNDDIINIISDFNNRISLINDTAIIINIKKN
jgi:hypothetical protein